MTPELIDVWDEICRRTLRRPLDDCPPTMIPSDTVVEGIFTIVQELGARELTEQVSLDDASLAVAEIFWKSAAAIGTVSSMATLAPKARDAIRELAKFVLISVQIMAHSGIEYGPVPTGLTGRPLGFAALALEILQQKSPQRLLAQQRRQQH